MSISKIALAIPLSLGIACSTSGTQSKSDHTGAMWTERHRDAATQAYMQGTGSQGEQEKAGGSGSSSSPGASGSSGSMGSSGSSDSSGSSGSVGSSGSSDTSGSASGSAGSSDQGTGGAMGSGGSSETMGSGNAPGSADQGTAGSGSSDHAQQGAASGSGDMMAHSDDQTVRGKVSKVSKQEISITPKGGEAKTLKLSPETVVTINGKDAKPTQLKQGQQVRASYSSQDGDEVAVKIEVGKARQGKSGGHMKGHGAGGHSGSSGMGGGSGGSTGGSDSGAGGTGR